MSFLMEHYELTVNLVVRIHFWECQVFILLCWDWDCVKVSSIIYMFLGNESVFFFRLFYYPLLDWGGSNVFSYILNVTILSVI